MRTFWGRCWEAGGAPAYWPWVQVLRAILRTAEPGQLDPFIGQLAQVLPELREGRTPVEATEIGPEQARFQLMDTVGHVLSDVAHRGPIVIILEDLHVADVSTILLLEFLTAVLRNQPDSRHRNLSPMPSSRSRRPERSSSVPRSRDSASRSNASPPPR